MIQMLNAPLAPATADVPGKHDPACLEMLGIKTGADHITRRDHGTPTSTACLAIHRVQADRQVHNDNPSSADSHLDRIDSSLLNHSGEARGLRGALLDRGCRRRRLGALPSPGRPAGWGGRFGRRNLLGCRFGRAVRRSSVGHAVAGSRLRPCKPYKWRSEPLIDGGWQVVGYAQYCITTALITWQTNKQRKV